MKQLGLVLLPLLLASCGPPLVWDKPGLADGVRQAEVADCQRLAWRQAVSTENDLLFHYRLGASRYALRHGYYPQPNFDRMAWEDRFYSTCMQVKGYRLIPLPQGG
ncbi:MAG: hypothetical protein OEL53_17295 [Rhodospirillales bacterium]|nr:hypothetical protein [Rhodospirillales bacterium]